MDHGGLEPGRGLSKALLQRGSEEQWGSRVVTKADVTLLVVKPAASWGGGQGEEKR